MPDKQTCRILACARDLVLLGESRRLLGAGGYEVDGHLLGTPEPEDFSQYHLVVIDGSQDRENALQLCRKLHGRLGDDFVPVLFFLEDHSPLTRLATLEAGADVCLFRPFGPGEVLAQAQALLRIKEKLDRLGEKAAEIHRINRRLQQAYQQIDQELELAQRIQSSFLPQSLPQIPQARFSVQYLLCGRVGGDFYDVFRLDEHHVGFYVADAMGHGVPASLLTIFVKKGVKAKEVFGKQYRLVPPAEVLCKLNRELIDQHLSENPFITMAYGVLNHSEGTLSMARAGHPYPLYVPKNGDCMHWKQPGLLLGVVDATFPDMTYALHPGDKVLFYSDGIDNARFQHHPAGPESLLACAAHHRDLPADTFVQRLARDLFGAAELPDDVTLLTLEMHNGQPQ